MTGSNRAAPDFNIMHRVCAYTLYSALFHGFALGQMISPSNRSDAFPVATYPRFNVHAASSVQFPTFQIAPLGQYANITRSYFLDLVVNGMVVNTFPSNVEQIRSRDFLYISCDVEDYAGEIGPSRLITIISSRSVKNHVIFYTRRAHHCGVADYASDNLPLESSIYTTLDPVVAGQIADMNFAHSTNALAQISADDTTYTDPTSPSYYSGPTRYSSSSSTAVAMIVLYSITGIITALFVSIIVTGAIRAHLHPERYGPRAGSNARGGQSRAKGIARAVLETIPIVKFGDQHKSTSDKDGDLEMKSPTSTLEQKETSTHVTSKTLPVTVTASPKTEFTVSPSNPDGSDELGTLGCSICTEEFTNGEEVRVLPCNHKYHPDCVDPWLLNVSGTCPLCRVDLRGSHDTDTTSVDPIMVIPASSSNMNALRSAFTGTRDERIAALQRFRSERRNRTGPQPSSSNEDQDYRRSLARRLTDRFRIRTRHHQEGHQSTPLQ